MSHLVLSILIAVTAAAPAAAGTVSTSAPVSSARTVGASRVGGALTTELIEPGDASASSDGRFRAELKDGFHFNLKAPNQIGGVDVKIKPQSSGNHLLEFVLPKGRSPEGLTATLYVCDDANTYCDIERRSLGKAVDAAEEKKPKTSLGLGSPDRDGFYHGDFAALLDRAGRERKSVLVEFAARWCPGCRRFAAEVLPSSSFRRESAKMLKFHADVDLIEVFEIAKKYNLQGVPTILILDSVGEEIARLVDYRRSAEVAAFLKGVREEARNLAQLQKACAAPQSSKETLLLLARRLLAAGRSDEAMTFLKRIEPAPMELREAQVKIADGRWQEKPADEARKIELRRALSEALKVEGESLRALLWQGRLAALEDKGSKARGEAVAAVNTLSQKLLKLPPDDLEKRLVPELVGEYAGLERFLIAVNRAEILDDLGDRPLEAKGAWVQAAEVGHAAAISDRQAGPGLRYLIVLIAAEKYTEADRWVLRLMKRDPSNKDLLRRRQVILNALKSFDEAVKVGEQSRRFAEGRMQFSVVENLAKSYIGAGKPERARDLLDSALERPELKLEKLQSQRDRLAELRRSL